jgi:segregation and condensation protein B
MPSRVDDLVLRVEAILFAAGKPMSVHDLTEALGAPDHRPVQTALKALQKAYANRQTAIELRRVGERYGLQLREAFAPAARPVTPVDMAPRTLKALTLIAYHQPILQSRLVRMLGETAYEEVQRLRDANLVRGEPKGSTLELTTTRQFAEQFGLVSTKPEEIRKFLEGKLHIPSGTETGAGGDVAPSAPVAAPTAAPDPGPAAPGPT